MHTFISKGYRFFLIFIIIPIAFLQGQVDSLSQTQQLKEVVLLSTRIDLPLKESARTIQILSSEELKAMGAVTIAEALQHFSGIDIRQRGVRGMQADLYIRGGSFDQTLLLIDGIKLDDAQTGHHTLNFLPPIELVERIEILKGPAARIFGQNAFTGAINIVTKKVTSKEGKLALQTGSYNQLNTALTYQNSSKNNSIITHYTRTSSEGYRYNTDFKNHTVFLKSGLFQQSKLPLDLITFFSGRKFGANGFYATPEARDQYEETEASLFALQSKLQKGNWLLKPRIYWRRGQDHYLYIRTRPEVYENWHITHKVGMSFDASYSSKLGKTGMGVDFSRVSIASTNLGDRVRQLATLFFEQQFVFFNGAIDLTPGLALNGYSDFGIFAYPGLDLGVALNSQWRFYGNLGTTYRIPTYTDLYYSDRTTLGNPDLKPEEAFSKEVGLRFSGTTLQFYLAYFDRKATHLIDYVKPNEEALWQATNIGELFTSGGEMELNYRFQWGKQNQKIRLGYTYLIDDLIDQGSVFSRYSLTSLKHHFTTSYTANLSSKVQAFLGIKYAQRVVLPPYIVIDSSLNWKLGDFQLNLACFNLLNIDYSETNLVPMPGRNALFSLQYNF